MKKYFIAALISLLTVSSVHAEEQIELDRVKNESTLQVIGPRGDMLSVSAYLDNGSIIIYIDGYDGNANIYLYDNTSNIITSESDIVYGYAVSNMAVNDVASGTYCLRIELDAYIYTGYVVIQNI